MHRICDNYISWSIAHMVAGLVIGAFGFFTRIDYPFYLFVVLVSLLVFQRLVRRDHKPDERETQLLLKVQSHAGVWTLVFLPAFHARLGDDFFSAIWGVFIFLRGCFGLYFFLRE